MIALDTNVLVRFLVEDDPEQTRRVKVRLQQAIESETQCFVSDIVLCEVVWVLQRSYRVSRSEILDTLRKLIRSKHLSFSNVERVRAALEAFGAGRGDFADYLIREDARASGCDTVITFDAELHEDPALATSELGVKAPRERRGDFYSTQTHTAYAQYKT